MQFSVRDVASIFKVAESTVYRWISEENLPATEVNGQTRFNRTDLLEWASVRRREFSPEIFQGTPASATDKLSLIEALQAGKIIYRLPGTTREAVLASIVEIMPVPAGSDREVLLQLFLARERAGSSGVGDGIAIPHPRHPVVLPVAGPLLTLCFLAQAVDFEAADRQPVHTLFVLVSPTIRLHLQMLARITYLLRDEPFRGLLRRRATEQELMEGARRVESSFEQKINGNPVEPAR
jgi:PTS system nitrogen regulatory IIA component